jgi:hypothetical protein
MCDTTVHMGWKLVHVESLVHICVLLVVLCDGRSLFS